MKKILLIAAVVLMSVAASAQSFKWAYVDFNDKRMNPDIPKYAFVCPGRESTCSACGACFNKKLKAVVFHQH